jgi:hypothetical protein
MSTVVTWSTKDCNGITSIYFISESRISWGSPNSIWDYGQKVFSLKQSGIIAYCGDVLFPTQTISQLKDLIDKEILFRNNETNENKIQIIKAFIENAFNNYPIKMDYTVILVSLVENKIFNLYEFTISNSIISIKELEVVANKPIAYGSGKKYFDKVFSRLKGDIYSRCIYQSFFKTIEEAEDKLSGGAIQLVGLYRDSRSQTFGIIQDNEKFIYGQKITSKDIPLNIEWRNRNFEITDEETLKIKKNAQMQPFNRDL